MVEIVKSSPRCPWQQAALWVEHCVECSPRLLMACVVTSACGVLCYILAADRCCSSSATSSSPRPQPSEPTLYRRAATRSAADRFPSAGAGTHTLRRQTQRALLEPRCSTLGCLPLRADRQPNWRMHRRRGLHPRVGLAGKKAPQSATVMPLPACSAAMGGQLTSILIPP